MNYNPLSSHGRGQKATYQPRSAKSAFKNLMRYLSRYKGKLIIAILFSLMSSCLSLVGPYLSGKALDYVDFGTGLVEFDKVYLYAVLLIIFYVVSAFLSYILSIMMLSIAQKFGKELRDDVFEHLKSMPVSFYDAHQSGDIISLVSYDIETITSSLSTDVVSILSAGVSVIGSFVMMLTIKPILTLIFLVTIPLSFIITRKMSRVSKKLFRKRSSEFGAFGGFTEERISGLRSIKAYARDKEILNEFDSINNESMNTAYNAERYSTKIGPFVNFISNLSLSLVAVFGAIFYLYQQMSIGQISSFVLYSRKFSGPINEMLNIFAEIQSALAASERVFNLLNQKEEDFDKEPLIVPDTINGNIEAKHIKFSYNQERVILHNLNFQAKKGSLTAIVGPTGAGKTTIINLLMKFYLPDEGQIELDNNNTLNIPSAFLRKQYAMVLQDAFLFEGTIKENIAYGNENASFDKIVRAAKLAHADGFISRLKDGYDTFISENGNSISKGQKQLLTIARAFLSDANMLILDEATSSVDTRTEKNIQKAMRELMHDKTCFVIAHRLSTIRNANLILMVHDGDIVEQGTHEELIAKKGFYYRLYQAQYK